MTLHTRDTQILRLISRFRQCSSKQISTLLFHSSGSPTSQKRALDRLVARGYLARVEHRLVGGVRGGSGQYVYQLGRAGWYTYQGGNYSPRRTVDYHALAIVEAFITLVGMERAGLLTIVGTSIDDACWHNFGGIDLRPDMFVELERQGRRRSLWLEIDQGTEGQRQVIGKLEAVIRAFDNADGNEWPQWPLTVWVGLDEARAAELKWFISRMAEPHRQFFVVSTQATLSATILQQLSTGIGID